MELSKVNPMQVSKHSSGPSKLDAIKLLLLKFSVRRQAQIGEAEYGVYSADLESFDLADIQTALEKWEPRREGETAFPDAPAMVAAVKKIKVERGNYEAIDKANALAEHRKANPEEYISGSEFQELIAGCLRKVSM